jgi:hypothetical protein
MKIHLFSEHLFFGGKGVVGGIKVPFFLEDRILKEYAKSVIVAKKRLLQSSFLLVSLELDRMFFVLESV